MSEDTPKSDPHEPADPATPCPSAPAPSRRSFLDLLLGLSALSWLGTVLYPVVRYLTPLPRSGPRGPKRLSPTELARLAEDDYVVVRAGGERVLVLTDPHGDVRAFSAACTHEACIVRYVPQDAWIWCACHNGRFDLEGHVIAGPPPRPLPRYEAHRDGEDVVVSTEEA